jgi:hypothetical protein
VSPSEASLDLTPVPLRTKSFGCCLDPPQLLAQLVRGSKPLRGRSLVRSADEAPVVGISTPSVHPLGASVAPRRTRGPLRPRRWSTQLLPWTNVPKSACKRIELSPSSFAALTGEYPANHANSPASTGFFASRRSPVRSRLAPLRKKPAKTLVRVRAKASRRPSERRLRVHQGCIRI